MTYQDKNMQSYFDNKDIIAGVKILTCKDCCENCKKLEGRNFKLENAPKLPLENCLHKKGCRCTYLPITIGTTDSKNLE